jgi:glycerol-3-phosphate dehydrogenase
MNRAEMISRLTDRSEKWDFIIIGGGATGIGTAIEAASRGYRTLLVEQSDFGKGTSSRSTKLIHGGVRYLKQGNLSLVLEALKERGILFRNAPHLVHNLPFVVPNYDWWEGPFYGIGLKLYDILAGREGFGDSKILTPAETVKHLPTIETQGLKGGVIYYDGQFDDARLVIDMVKTAAEQGAALVNYMAVEDILKTQGMVSGIRVRDQENDREYEVKAKVIINATGVFADRIRQLDDAQAAPLIQPSQGIHLVLDPSFLPGDSAIMIPQTDDGRVLFAIPWHGRVVIGTTETVVKAAELEPEPFPEEVEFLLSHAARYLTKDPQQSDILSIFAGLRPLVADPERAKDSAALSRDHLIHISRAGLVTVAGGKWTTYRKMAEDVIDQAAILAQLEVVPSVSKNLNIHGYHSNARMFGEFQVYGSDAPALLNLLEDAPQYRQRLHKDLPAYAGEIIWAVRDEMARTVEDFLSRRTRSLLLNTRASMEIAPRVAEIMAEELKQDDAWKQKQVRDYLEVAKRYMV